MFFSSFYTFSSCCNANLSLDYLDFRRSNRSGKHLSCLLLWIPSNASLTAHIRPFLYSNSSPQRRTRFIFLAFTSLLSSSKRCKKREFELLPASLLVSRKLLSGLIIAGLNKVSGDSSSSGYSTLIVYFMIFKSFAESLNSVSHSASYSAMICEDCVVQE